jgi:hypothetical protein
MDEEMTRLSRNSLRLLFALEDMTDSNEVYETLEVLPQAHLIDLHHIVMDIMNDRKVKSL